MSILKSILGGALKHGSKAAVGYGVYKGANMAADELDNQVGGVRIGGLYTGGLRAAGALTGGYMGLSAASGAVASSLRGVANIGIERRAAGAATRVFNERMDAVNAMHTKITGTDWNSVKKRIINKRSHWTYNGKGSLKATASEQVGRIQNRMRRTAFGSPGSIAAARATTKANLRKSSKLLKAADWVDAMPRRALGLAGKGLWGGSKQVGKAGWAAVKAPMVVAGDIANIARGRVPSIGGFATGTNMGARALGWGAMAGGAVGMAGARLGDWKDPYAGAALGGTQTYDPTSGSGPRRGMDPNASNTSGLVQSLHRLR